jgi:cytochrome c-type biogenesis protein CcmH/NrfF
MQPTLASHFLAGAILTWALPIGLLAVVGIYWAVVLRKREFDEPS